MTLMGLKLLAAQAFKTINLWSLVTSFVVLALQAGPVSAAPQRCESLFPLADGGVADRSFKPGPERKAVHFYFTLKNTVSTQSTPQLEDFLAAFSSRVRAIQRILPREVWTPETINLIVGDDSGNSQYKRMNDSTAVIELAIPKTFKGLEKAAFTQHLLAMALHEYGHALLETTLRQNSPRFRQYKEISNLQTSRSAEESGVMSDVLFVKAYEEFFADFVAVVFTGKLNCVSEALLAAGETHESANVRSFSVKHEIQGWDYYGPYGLLAPARSHLGPHIAKVVADGARPGGANRASEFVAGVLASVLKAIDLERAALEERVQAKHSHAQDDIDPEQVNRRFVNVLKAGL